MAHGTGGLATDIMKQVLGANLSSAQMAMSL